MTPDRGDKWVWPALIVAATVVGLLAVRWFAAPAGIVTPRNAD